MYDLIITVVCVSFQSCGLLAHQMNLVVEEPAILAAPVRRELNEPMMKVLSVSVSTDVVGNAAPGVQAAAVPSPASSAVTVNTGILFAMPIQPLAMYPAALCVMLTLCGVGRILQRRRGTKKRGSRFDDRTAL